MENDPDVFVFGSKNGFGKTSLLESCALLLFAGFSGRDLFDLRRLPEMPIALPDLLVRAGTAKSHIEGGFTLGESSAKIKVAFSRDGKSKVEGNLKEHLTSFKNFGVHPSEITEQFLFSLIGVDEEPLFLPGLMYFHSYRKIQEGNPELGMMVESERPSRRSLRPAYWRRFSSPVSTFKIEVLRSMMRRADLFEMGGNEQPVDTLDTLNGLLEHYARGTIEKLKPSPNNTLDFRITPTGGGPSFAFDGLSSGQKEIISTLFLIWFYSKSQPSIVLIDEPELHLNAEWQQSFIRQLHELAPWNQYLIATHSEDVFGSVAEDRRFLLTPNEVANK